MFKKLFALGVLALALTFGFAAPALAITGQLVYEYNNSTNITTSTTTVVKSTAGVLHAVCVNTAGLTSTLTLFNNTAASGTKIATMTTLTQGCFLLDANFTIGLTAVTAGGTAGDITLLWR
jgi:hypothetical protein